MAFDPVPRTASEYQKGAAFGHATVMRQIDAGQRADVTRYIGIFRSRGRLAKILR